MTDTYTPMLTDEQILAIGAFGQSPLKRLDHGRAIERVAIEAFRFKINQPSGFEGRCPRCWPAFCTCPAPADEVESIKAERFLLDCELQRENRRAREFSIALSALASGIYQHRERLLAEHGLDGVSEDLHRLGEQAKQAAELMDEPRNEDRVSALYARLSPPPGANIMTFIVCAVLALVVIVAIALVIWVVAWLGEWADPWEL